MSINNGAVFEAEASPDGGEADSATGIRGHAALAEPGTAGAKVEVSAAESQLRFAGATPRRRAGPRDQAPPLDPEQNGVGHVQLRPAHTEARCEGVLRLETWPIDRLLPSPRNARTHSDAQVAEIAGSIRAFGFANPILVGDDSDVIAGHGRMARPSAAVLTRNPSLVSARETRSRISR